MLWMGWLCRSVALTAGSLSWLLSVVETKVHVWVTVPSPRRMSFRPYICWSHRRRVKSIWSIDSLLSGCMAVGVSRDSENYLDRSRAWRLCGRPYELYRLEAFWWGSLSTSFNFHPLLNTTGMHQPSSTILTMIVCFFSSINWPKAD